MDVSQTIINAVRTALERIAEASVDTGVADNTSLVSRLDDASKNWSANVLVDLIVEITAGSGEGQVRKIASNTATSLVPVTDFTIAPDATSQYRIGFYGKMTGDIAFWGGTALTGRDISLDLARLDITISALRDALRDAICAAAPNAKTLNDLYAYLARYAQLPTALTAAGNLKQSLEESTIKQPTDVQDHFAQAVVLHASGAETASGQSGDIDVGQFLYGELCVDTTAVAGTTPTLDVYIEGKDETSGKYKVIWQPAQITAIGTAWATTLATLAFRLIRIRWVIAGTTPSFTFSAALSGKC